MVRKSGYCAPPGGELQVAPGSAQPTRLERWFDPKTDKKYGALYNFDVRFADLRGAVGMKLETSGELTAYDACALKNAAEGTWFFVSQETEE